MPLFTEKQLFLNSNGPESRYLPQITSLGSVSRSQIVFLIAAEGDAVLGGAQFEHALISFTRTAC